VVTLGLERLQQLMDAMIDEGVVIRQHIYRVRDARDAHLTVHRHRAIDWRLDDTTKHILVDLPTRQCEEFLKLQASSTGATRYSRYTCIIRVSVWGVRKTKHHVLKRIIDDFFGVVD